MPQITHETLVHCFTYHAPNPNQTERYTRLRDAGLVFAQQVLALCPDSPERTLALRDIQRAVMMANAAIALNE